MEKGLYQERNLTMLADFYEFTMANGYLESGAGDCDVVFDLSMSGIDKLADLTEFDAMYLSDGYWYLQGFKGNPPLNEDGAISLIAYFDESGKYVGCTPTTMHPDPSYDSLNAAMSVDH